MHFHKRHERGKGSPLLGGNWTLPLKWEGEGEGKGRELKPIFQLNEEDLPAFIISAKQDFFRHLFAKISQHPELLSLSHEGHFLCLGRLPLQFNPNKQSSFPPPPSSRKSRWEKNLPRHQLPDLSFSQRLCLSLSLSHFLLQGLMRSRDALFYKGVRPTELHSLWSHYDYFFRCSVLAFLIGFSAYFSLLQSSNIFHCHRRIGYFFLREGQFFSLFAMSDICREV